MRQYIYHKPHKYLSNTLDGALASASPPPDPQRKPLLFSFAIRWDVAWLYIHWVMQDTKEHPFQVHGFILQSSKLLTINY